MNMLLCERREKKGGEKRKENQYNDTEIIWLLGENSACEDEHPAWKI